jgi:hypothetical protein
METVARTIKVGLQQFPVRGPSDFNDVFERMEQGHVEAVATLDDAVLTANIQVIAALALKRRLPLDWRYGTCASGRSDGLWS